MTMMLPLPVMPPAEPLNCIYQAQQHGDFHQRANGSRQSLVTVHPERRDRHRNSQLEVIARSREALSAGKFVPEPAPEGYEQCREEYHGEVDNQWSGHPDDGHNLMNDVPTLGREQYQDREEQADQRPGAQPRQKFLVIPLLPDQVAQSEACHYCCA